MDVLQSQGISGHRVLWWRDKDGDHRCYARATSGPSCLKVFVDGLPMLPEAAIDAVPPHLISFAIVLRPNEAGVLFGDDAQHGVLYLVSKMRASKTRR